MTLFIKFKTEKTWQIKWRVFRNGYTDKLGWAHCFNCNLVILALFHWGLASQLQDVYEIILSFESRATICKQSGYKHFSHLQLLTTTSKTPHKSIHKTHLWSRASCVTWQKTNNSSLVQWNKTWYNLNNHFKYIK